MCFDWLLGSKASACLAGSYLFGSKYFIARTFHASILGTNRLSLLGLLTIVHIHLYLLNWSEDFRIFVSRVRFHGHNREDQAQEHASAVS